ncbi:hypothetical protein [Marinobacter salicampi]|uniref:hypothetical protein n=1 Tax=Marinobacter salicampi TaxID=435907 RepID=UPI00140AF1E0|nr:hypothetical protein [Marinobacter salicampi]
MQATVPTPNGMASLLVWALMTLTLWSSSLLALTVRSPLCLLVQNKLLEWGARCSHFSKFRLVFMPSGAQSDTINQKGFPIYFRAKESELKKIKALPFVLALLLGLEPTWAGTELENDPPEHYRFSYQTANNGRVVENSVCKEYSGLDWKGCRRYAQWHFAVKCWNLGYDIKHQNGAVRQKMLKEIDFFCDAKRRVTPMR